MSEKRLSEKPKRQLSLFDSTCLITGIIIGAGIYEVAPMVAKGTSYWWMFMGIWVVGGVLSLCGALGYAELASAYPKEGGDYVYLNRAYGRPAGFLFGWVQLSVVRPGDIAGMAFIFGGYALKLYDPLPGLTVAYDKLSFGLYGKADVPCSLLLYACAAVAVLTVINVLGVQQGKWTQNLLTVAKALGLLAIVGVAVFAWYDRPGVEVGESAPTDGAPVAADDLFTFDGNAPLTVPPPGVLANDVDPNGDSLSAALAGDPPKGKPGAAFELRADGSFTYTPKPNSFDSASFTYKASDGKSESSAAKATLAPFPGLALALILVLFTFGGWNEMAYVAAEVKDPKRSIVRALVLGTVAVTVLYLLVNAAFLHTLGYVGVGTSSAVATDTVETVFPKLGGAMISVLICVSALGAVNGLIFTGARISYAVGTDHRVFRRLGRWHPRTGTPVSALLLQGLIAIVLILLLGSFVDAILYTAAAVYSFYLATSLAVVVLRRKEPGVERPYRVTGYPLPTVVFCAVCVFLIYSAVVYKPWVAAGALAIALLGLPIYWLSSRGSIDDYQTR